MLERPRAVARPALVLGVASAAPVNEAFVKEAGDETVDGCAAFIAAAL